MVALILCIAAFAICFWAGRRSVGWGLAALLTFGYFYGIVRANLITGFSHFVFDAAMIGLYIANRWKPKNVEDGKRSAPLRLWTIVLLVWPTLMLLMPFQPLLVSLVGLRGNLFFIPVLLLASQIKERDLVQLCCGLAFLNVIACGFATAEYFTTVQRFFPPSPVTTIIYISGDVAGGYFRIPAIFSSAHAYGGTMVCSLPFLLGFWNASNRRLLRYIAVVGIGSALIGILMSATRQNFLLGSAMVIASILTTKMRAGRRVIFLFLIAGVGFMALSNPRFQRFKSLGDTDAVAGRIAGSVNRGFLEILTEHPMGNGLGGGGTSIPYFLEGQVRNPIGMENEYARILAEQGIIGLLIWIGFLGWMVSRGKEAFRKNRWGTGRRMAWCLAVFVFGTAWIGTGCLTSIPQTVLMLLGVGWSITPMPAEPAASAARPVLQSMPAALYPSMIR